MLATDRSRPNLTEGRTKSGGRGFRPRRTSREPRQAGLIPCPPQVLQGLLIAFASAFVVAGVSHTSAAEADDAATPAVQARRSADLAAPFRLQADGKPIDIGELSTIAHAGPWIADVDCDGDRDLLVGDFPGYFWFFENKGTDKSPNYTSRGKLQAGGEAAKTPVY